MKKSCLILWFSLLFIPTINSQIRLSKNTFLSRKHSVNQLRKDIDFTFKKIKKLHPNLYHYITEKELDRKIDSVKKSINTPLTSEEFYFIITPLIAEIKQGHNTVYFPTILDGLNNPKYPKQYTLLNCFEFEKIEGKIVVSNFICDSNNPLLGAEIISINNTPTSYYTEKYGFAIQGDGLNTTFNKRMKALYLSEMVYNENNELDSINISFLFNNSIIDTTFYQYKYYQSYDEYDPDWDSEVRVLTKKNPEEIEEYRDSVLNNTHFYKYLDSNKTTALLTIKGFGASNFSIYDSCFKEFDSLKTKTLIIDLRNNLGGSLDEIHYLTRYLEQEEFVFINEVESSTKIPITKAIWGTEDKGFSFIYKLALSPILMIFEQFGSARNKDKIIYKHAGSKLSKPQKHNFKGNVYVLINGNSYSASSILSAYLQGSGIATIVGEECGGAYNGCVAGIPKVITLPHSKLYVSFGMLYTKTPYTQFPDGYGVIPDYTIFPTLEHHKKGIDTELEWILKQIEKNKVVEEN